MSWFRKYRPKWPNVILATSTGLIGLWLFENGFFGSDINIDKLGYLSLDAIPFSMPDFSPTTFYEVAEALIMGAEWILAASTKYLIRMTPDGITTLVKFAADFYED